MRVGFFTVFRKDPVHYVLGEILVRSIREAMPGVEVVQFTDETSPPVFGVDRLVRKPHGKMLQRRMEHYAEATGDWLLLDTDIIVRQDICDVFATQGPFDVALADREWSLVKDHWKYSTEMPFNTGVVFSANPAFYARALAVWMAYPSEKQGNWWSEQWAVAEAAATGEFVVKVLPGMIYNRPPATREEDLSDAAILHYKGPIRKMWMRELYSPERAPILAPPPREEVAQ